MIETLQVDMLDHLYGRHQFDATKVGAHRECAMCRIEQQIAALQARTKELDLELTRRAMVEASQREAINWAIEQVEANERPPNQVLANIGRGLRRVRDGGVL